MEPSAGQLVAQIVTAVVCVTACFLSIFQLIAEYKFRQELSHREEEARRHGMNKRYQNIAQLHRIVHRLNVIIGILLALRCIDPVGTHGIYKQYSISILSYNAASTLLALAGSLFYSTLRAGYAMSIRRSAGAALIENIERFFIVLVASIFVVANLTILLRLAVIDRFWNYGLYLVWNAFALLLMLVAFDLGALKLRRSVKEMAAAEIQRRAYSSKASIMVSAAASEAPLHQPIADTDDHGHESSKNHNDAAASGVPSDDGRPPPPVGSTPATSSQSQLNRDRGGSDATVRNAGSRASHSKSANDKDKVTQVEKSMAKLSKVQLWSNILASLSIIAGFTFGFSSLNAKEKDAKVVSGFVFQSWAFFWIQTAALILAMWYSWIPDSLALFQESKRRWTVWTAPDRSSAKKASQMYVGGDVRITMSPANDSAENASVDGDET